MPWFIKTQSGESGPFPSQKLRQLIAAGKLTERALIRRHADSEWLPAGSVEKFFPKPLNSTEPCEPVHPTKVNRFATAITKFAGSLTGIAHRKPALSSPLQQVKLLDNPTVVIRHKPTEIVESDVEPPRYARGFGFASLILGVFSVLIFWLPYLGVGLSCVAVGLGIAGVVAAIARGGQGLFYPMAGTSVSFVGIVLGGIWSLLLTTAVTMASKLGKDSKEQIAQPVQQIAIAPGASAVPDDGPVSALSALNVVRPATVATAPATPPPRPIYSPPQPQPRETAFSPPKRSRSSSSKNFKESDAEKLWEKMTGKEIVHKKDGTTYTRKARKK